MDEQNSQPSTKYQKWSDIDPDTTWRDYHYLDPILDADALSSRERVSAAIFIMSLRLEFFRDNREKPEILAFIPYLSIAFTSHEILKKLPDEIKKEIWIDSIHDFMRDKKPPLGLPKNEGEFLQWQEGRNVSIDRELHFGKFDYFSSVNLDETKTLSDAQKKKLKEILDPSYIEQRQSLISLIAALDCEEGNKLYMADIVARTFIAGQKVPSSLLPIPQSVKIALIEKFPPPQNEVVTGASPS